MWLSEELAPDRFSVARDGYLVSGTWYEVDLLDEVGGFAGEDLDIFSCLQCRLDGSGSDEFGFAGASTGVGVALSRAVCVGDCVLLRYSFCGSALSTLCMTLF